MKKKTKVWEKILIAIGVMVGVVAVTNIYDMMHSLFTGIQISENGELEVKSHKKIPTEEQLEILYNSGSWASDIKDMKENGMDSVTQAYVETAQIMMDHLEEKYGIPFMACGGDGGPGLLGSGGYENFMYALEGEYAYQKFETKYGVDAAGHVYYDEEYYLMLHTMEVQEELQKLVDKNGLNIKVTASLEGSVKDVKGEDEEKELFDVLKENYITIDVWAFMRPEVSETQFNKQAKEFSELLRKKNIDIEITLFRLKYDETFDSIHDKSDLENKDIWPTYRPHKLFDLEYDDYIV